ncbi:MAG: peptide deformylase [Flavobacteriales bacterium]|nr:peptide deformylase [Flavobacteriales bacterium]
MILPVVAYGDPVLKQECDDVDHDYPELSKLIENMFETMYEAAGVGLAAPQVGKTIRLFIVDAAPFAEDDEGNEYPEAKDFRRVFINPEIIEERGDEWGFEEGCLSIPNIREEVFRQPELSIEYYDENFKRKKEKLSGIAARIVQHEHDHIEGVLFTDHLNPLKRRLLKRKLMEISKGITTAKYRMRFPNTGKKR